MPGKFRDTESFTPLQMEAALCAWEWMCDSRDGPLLKDLFEGLGTAGMRHCSIQAGDIALRVHDHMMSEGYEFADAYDWEFVPSVLQKLDWDDLVSDNQFSGAAYNPDVSAIFTAMVAADKSAHTDPSRRSFHRSTSYVDWLKSAQEEAAKQWRYEGLVSDHMERCENAYANGDDPATFIKCLGEKYDLIPASAW